MSTSDQDLTLHLARYAMDAVASLRSPLRPNSTAATTTMLNRTEISSSERVATCGGAAMSTTATTTPMATTSIHSSTAYKGL